MESAAARKESKSEQPKPVLPVITAKNIEQCVDRYTLKKARWQRLFSDVSAGYGPLLAFQQQVATQKEALTPDQLCDLIQILLWKPVSFDPKNPPKEQSKTDFAFKPLQDKFGARVWAYITDFRLVRRLTPKDLEAFYQLQDAKENELHTLAAGLVNLKRSAAKMDDGAMRAVLYAHPKIAMPLSHVIAKFETADFSHKFILNLVEQQADHHQLMLGVADNILAFKPYIAPLQNGKWFLLVQKLSEIESFEELALVAAALKKAADIIKDALMPPNDKDFCFDKGKFVASDRYEKMLDAIIKNLNDTVKLASDFKALKKQELNPHLFYSNALVAKMAMTTLPEHKIAADAKVDSPAPATLKQ